MNTSRLIFDGVIPFSAAKGMFEEAGVSASLLIAVLKATIEMEIGLTYSQSVRAI